MSSEVYFTGHDRLKLHAVELPIPGALCTLEYLNEGGANFVYKILPHAESGILSPYLQSKLLRLRKDLSHVQSAEEQLLAFESHFRSLFPPENLVQHELVDLDEAVQSLLNDALEKLVRPSHRLRDFLPADERHGLLITDMTPHPGDVFVQLKPKWLTQSPNAPTNARRCRTCAVRAQRASQQLRTATDAQDSCPLELVSDKLEDRKRTAQSITTDRALQEYLVEQAQPLLQKLRECQLGLDDDGLLNASDTPAILNVCKAMTLRDCTFFLKRSAKGIEARLADLDLKQPEKLAKWKAVEQDLIKLGWYTNTESKTVWKEEKVCILRQK